MLTAQEREAAFRADLAALLAKHGADIEIHDHCDPYGFQRAVAEVTMLTVRDEADNIVKDFASFNL